MFGIFKSKSESEKLQNKYNALMKDWHRLSSINRSQSDLKFLEAEEVMTKINNLKKNEFN